MTWEQELIAFIVGQIVTGAAIWGGIRADIKAMHSRMDDIKQSADEAHRRIDDHIERQLAERRA